MTSEVIFERNELLYENRLASDEDVQDFVMEGEGVVSFPLDRMRMENQMDPEEGQKANFVWWCPEDFPDRISITWDFWPIREPGLAILFFAAKGEQGQSIFAPELNKRVGIYKQYHHGDINAYHVSYFRRRNPGERIFHTCNLRKSYGFHMVAQGADPLPSVADVEGPYKIEVIKYEGTIRFLINDLLIFNWQDDGQTYGPVWSNGKIGFRQMAPLIAEYANLQVHRISAHS